MPDALEVIVQRREGDCAIAAVAMLTGTPYRLAGDVARHLTKRLVHTTGLTTREILRLSARLGVPLTPGRPIDLEDASGLLIVHGADQEYHTVVLFHGVIVDPLGGMLYTIEAYEGMAKVVRFLRV